MITLRRCLVIAVEVEIEEGEMLAPYAADALELYAKRLRDDTVFREDMEKIRMAVPGRPVVKTVHGASELYARVGAEKEG